VNGQRIQQFILKPWVIIACLLLGFSLGLIQPAIGLELGVVGDIYVDLLKMIVLPFMVSAIVFSLQRLFQEGGASRIAGRVVLAFAGFSMVAAVIGVVTLSLAQPGSNLSETTLTTFGRIVGNDLSSTDTAMNLYGADMTQSKGKSLEEVVLSLIPSNIFEALAKGETLKALIFSLLFGMALGHVPNRISGGLSQTLETVYQTCQTLTRWLNFPLPIVLICMSASQIAKSGVEPLLAMANFVLAFGAASLIFLALAVFVIWKRSNASLSETLNALREPFALAIATRSSVTCMPAMIESLVQQLSFAKAKVELLVPLSVSMLRVGPILYYACATLFIAQLYGRSLSAEEILLLLVASVLAGFASAGMTGLVTLSLTSMACGYLGLPFEAAFILFLAVDPICDILRTLVLVIGNTAAVATICPRPLKI
jgi:Na+/H+-dicarboxylate symporter